MSSSFGGNPPDGLQDARQSALGLLTAAITSDDPALIGNYVVTVLPGGGDALQTVLELLGGMAGISRTLIEMREEERGIPHEETLQELGRRVASPGE